MTSSHYELEVEFPLGILGFLYSYHGDRDSIYGRFSISVTPNERHHIRLWKEWDKIRDSGWEYWLEILYQFVREGA